MTNETNGLHQTEIRVGAWSTEYTDGTDKPATGVRVWFQVGGFVESDPLEFNPRARVIWEGRAGINALFDPRPAAIPADTYALECAAAFVAGGDHLTRFRKSTQGAMDVG